MTGLDPDPAALAFARGRSPGLQWVEGDAQQLPFEDDTFDYAVSVTALCFVPDVAAAVGEIARVARKRWAIGVLNRHSLLYLQKGLQGGTGAYRGARWHSPAQARTLMHAGSRSPLREGNAIYFPGGGRVSRWLEPRLPSTLPLGAFLVVAGDANGFLPRGSVRSAD